MARISIDSHALLHERTFVKENKVVSFWDKQNRFAFPFQKINLVMKP